MPATDCQKALIEWARDEGRSASARFEGPHGLWTGHVRGDVLRPAASLLKLPLAIAVETHARIDMAAPAAGVGELLTDAEESTILRALDPGRVLTTGELLALALSASDGPAARFLLAMVGVPAVEDALGALGCVHTVVTVGPPDAATLTGWTTAEEAVSLISRCSDPDAFPLTARALRHSIRNSRIPIGAQDLDVTVAHKTGTLPGVASDIAVITGDVGTLAVAFLTDQQHDTLVAGYEMGICTRRILESWGVRANRTMSAVVGS